MGGDLGHGVADTVGVLRAKMPETISAEIRRVVAEMGSRAYAVRSSALGEDSAGVSFAGLHESVVGVMGEQGVIEAVRQVWASLWSDAALLYRRELSLDPTRSRMAVLVQEVIVEDRSGVAFGRDPRNLETDCAIIEAVPGQCALLVDGAVDPDRWILRRDSGELVQWRPGIRDEAESAPLLKMEDLGRVLDLLGCVEKLFGWPPDVEWTGRSSRLTLLQARPITTADTKDDDKRSWYLSLRPGKKRLETLAKLVSEELIPSWRTKESGLPRKISTNTVTKNSLTRSKVGWHLCINGKRFTGTISSPLRMAYGNWLVTTTMPCVRTILTNSSVCSENRICWPRNETGRLLALPSACEKTKR